MSNETHPYKVGELHVLLLEGWNVSTARIASREPLIWEIGDKTEVHVTQEEFLPYRKEGGDVQGSGTTRRMSYEEEMV